MPRLSAFYGIVIGMYHREHGIPHFHVVYAEHRASVAIDTLEILGGSLPDRAHRLVREWAQLHRDELVESWERARAGRPMERIAPLP